jgi:eukaryotic-like serine/threonine-protein kinase
MPLTPGTKLGPYEIVSALGAGGMGEVYRAKDTRLDRTVAIKILKEQFSKDPIRKQRFEREAKAISGLNHPNICTLYDVGSQNGTEYLVLEYVDGDSLAQRLTKGPLPIEQVLKVGREIADALDRAHRSGIVHRDLKPGNIMLTKAGAKLLDFGLARSISANASIATLTASAVPQAYVTEEGTIVGTFQYMSPEQVEAKELDARSDIFSLGAVLYEMVTGQRAFEGKSQLSVVSAILEKEPAPISGIKPFTPRSLDHIIRRCLAKDRDERWQSARDLALELKAHSTLDSSPQDSGILPVTRHKNSRERLAWAVATLALLTAAFLLLRSSSKSAPGPDLVVSTILPDQWELDESVPVAISPNGKYLVFSAGEAGFGDHSLWLRSLDSPSAKMLPNTEGAENPFWSPDSRWIAFTAYGKLRKIAIDGGVALDICDGGKNRGGSWGPDGTILFVPNWASPVYSVSSNGGTPTPVTQLDNSHQEITHRWPQFLPDGKHFLFFARALENSIYVGSLGSSERKLILKQNSNALYSSPGFLLFQQHGKLMAQFFDLKRLELRGTALSVADNVAVNNVWQHALFSLSDTGRLVFQTRADRLVQPVWTDRSGKILESLTDPTDIYGGVISRDGQQIAFTIDDSQEGTTDIWALDLARHVKTRLTFEPLVAHSPTWSPDQSRVYFGSNRFGLTQVFSVRATGMGQAERLFSSESADAPSSWSPDGRYLAVTRTAGGDAMKSTIWVFENFGDHKLRPLLASSHPPEWGAVFSPNGKWLAYHSNESGRTQVYVVSFPEASAKILVSKDFGVSPKWSRDGNELFYVATDNMLTVASLKEKKSGLQIDRTTSLFKVKPTDFDVSPDGRRILIYRPVENTKRSSITLITNWPALLSKQ